MRFYLLPKDKDVTTCVNFDQITTIRVVGSTIELYFVGVETPMVIAKTPTTLALVGKGMDLFESSKEVVNAL